MAALPHLHPVHPMSHRPENQACVHRWCRLHALAAPAAPLSQHALIMAPLLQSAAATAVHVSCRAARDRRTSASSQECAASQLRTFRRSAAHGNSRRPREQWPRCGAPRALRAACVPPAAPAPGGPHAAYCSAAMSTACAALAAATAARLPRSAARISASSSAAWYAPPTSQAASRSAGRTPAAYVCSRLRHCAHARHGLSNEPDVSCCRHKRTGKRGEEASPCCIGPRSVRLTVCDRYATEHVLAHTPKVRQHDFTSAGTCAHVCKQTAGALARTAGNSGPGCMPSASGSACMPSSGSYPPADRAADVAACAANAASCAAKPTSDPNPASPPSAAASARARPPGTPRPRRPPLCPRPLPDPGRVKVRWGTGFGAPHPSTNCGLPAAGLLTGLCAAQRPRLGLPLPPPRSVGLVGGLPSGLPGGLLKRLRAPAAASASCGVGEQRQRARSTMSKQGSPYARGNGSDGE